MTVLFFFHIKICHFSDQKNVIFFFPIVNSGNFVYFFAKKIANFSITKLEKKNPGNFWNEQGTTKVHTR